MCDTDHIGDWLRLAALVAFAAAATVGLHRLGAMAPVEVDWSDVAGWAASQPAEDVVAATARLVGLAAGYWVLASSGLYVLARLSQLPGAVRAVRWAALPPVRRLADRAVAGALTTTMLAGPAAAADAGPPPPPVAQTDGAEAAAGHEPMTGQRPLDVGHVDPTASPLGVPPLPTAPEPVAPVESEEEATDDVDGTADDHELTSVGEWTSAAEGAAAPPPPSWGAPPLPTTPPDPVTPQEPNVETTERSREIDDEAAADAVGGGEPAEPVRTSTAQSSDGPPPASTAEQQTYTVAAGDHLWGVATRTLAEAWGREPSTAEVGGYWRQLVDDNTEALASGDPDLIYPGEVLILPVIPSSEE